MGFVFSGSGDIPNGRFTLTPAQLAAAQTAAGGSGTRRTWVPTVSRSMTPAPRAASGWCNRPADDFNLTQYNYLQVPQERWMLNAFTHYEFAPKATGYLEFHFSNNRVDQQLTQANIGGDFLFNTNNPYLDANMRATLVALDAAETGPRTLQQGPIAYTTTPNDGLAVLTAGTTPGGAALPAQRRRPQRLAHRRSA